MKQTPVEWLADVMRVHLTHEQQMQFEGLFQQAMYMEMKQRESDFVYGYKERAEISNLIFDEASMILAKQLFSNKLENQKQLIVEIMEEDSKDGLYDIPLQECVNCNEQKKVHSMCLDCCIKLGNQNQTEISDEKIEKEAKQTYREHPNNPKEFTDWSYGKDVNFARKQKAFIKGAKWYREQLKSKGNG